MRYLPSWPVNLLGLLCGHASFFDRLHVCSVHGGVSAHFVWTSLIGMQFRVKQRGPTMRPVQERSFWFSAQLGGFGSELRDTPGFDGKTFRPVCVWICESRIVFPLCFGRLLWDWTLWDSGFLFLSAVRVHWGCALSRRRRAWRSRAPKWSTPDEFMGCSASWCSHCSCQT